jgi:hypothetical protein
MAYLMLMHTFHKEGLGEFSGLLPR